MGIILTVINASTCIVGAKGIALFGGEAGCVISEGPWLLVGMPNLVNVSSEYHSLAWFLGCSKPITLLFV